MTPELKRYYLMQSSYWCQQLIILVLGLEKPRKDYTELVAHHLVTLWLVGLVGLATLSPILLNSEQMELFHKSYSHRQCGFYEHGYSGYIPGCQYPHDFGRSHLMPNLQFSKLLNYIQWDNAKTYAFAIFIAIWT